MKRILLRGKVHKATVTEANLEYDGSLGLDEDLMKAAGMIPYEKVHVFNVTNGHRFSTYLLKAPAGSGTVGIYGAAAHRAGKGDKLIIVSYVFLDESETDSFVPRIVLVDAENRIRATKT